MKNLLLTALVAIVFSSCQKMTDFTAPEAVAEIAKSDAPSQVVNLGHPFTGTNVTWKINPSNPGNSPLFTYLPNQNSGYCMLMIDNGEVDGLTPLHAFKFVAVNIQDLTSKVIAVKTADGSTVTSSLGRITRYIFGTDKKFYVATEGSAGGGGHLVQYDPNTQTAVDLGKPFKSGNSYLDIYSLNVGTDGALYGGSFGGEGDVKTFRYSNGSFYVDETPLDNSSRYVAYISGDSRYTYAVCGKNNWALYAVDRQTGEKKTMMYNAGSSVAIDIASNEDAPYAHSVATHYRMKGFTMTSLGEYNRPATNRVVYNPYEYGDATLPQAAWNDADKKVTYQLPSGSTGSIRVTGLEEDVYPTAGPIMYWNNKLYLTSTKLGVVGQYTPGTGFQTLGSTTMVINDMIAPPATGADANKIFLGGYPKGGLLQFDPFNNWSVNVAGFKAENGGFATSTSNPKQSALFQNADATGTNGSMSLINMAYTKNNFIVSAGDNDRITTTSGRELSIGSFKNGTVRNLYLPEFSNYEYRTLCLSKDSNYAFIGAIPHSGNNGKIYKYNPATNSIVASWDFNLWGERGIYFQMYSEDLLVGYLDDSVFLFDVKKGEIIWKQTLGQGKRIYALNIGPDNSVYILHVYLSITNFRLVKYNINAADHSNVLAQSSVVADVRDEDNDERTKPGRLLFVAEQGVNHLYISGLNSLYRVRI
jgi:hypothetical protein